MAKLIGVVDLDPRRRFCLWRDGARTQYGSGETGLETADNSCE
jgi:hypothetical protein